MSKLIKNVSEPDNTIAYKLRDSLIKQQDTIDADRGSPITPLQTRPSGLTSAATTTTISSSSSSSSGSISGRTGLTPVSKKTELCPSNPSAVQSSKSSTSSAAQSASINLAGVRLKPSSNSAAQSSKSGAAKSKSGEKPSKSNTFAAAQSGFRSPKTANRNPNSARGTKPPCKISTPPPQQVKIAPTGNLFPSGKVQITGMAQGNPKSMVLGPGAQSYGYGNIIRGNSFPPSKPTTTTSVSSPSSSSRSLVIAGGGGGDSDDGDTPLKRVMSSSNSEQVKRIGNEMFKKGCFSEALKLYDRAIELSPTNPAYRSNRAAALSSLGRIGEAVIECEEAIKLDPNFVRAHHRLAALLLRLGQVDNAGKHFFSAKEPIDPMVVKVLEKVDKHLNKCEAARKRGEWNIVLTEVCSAMASGADWSPQLAMCKVEALLKLLRLDDAQTVLAFVPKVEPLPNSRLFDMNSEAYISFVKSQMELALGRFENAVTAAEKASEIDPRNIEVETLYRNVRLIAKARERGNNLYESERYTEASLAYTEGLKFDPSNATLFSHRADCFFKVGMWERSIEDCNHALLIQPSYRKPLLQRAASYTKLERWAEAVKDYEILRKELCYDKEIAESLFRAQVALKKSRGDLVLNMEFGGEVEEISSLEEFRAALTRPGVSIVHFFRNSDQQCNEISVFVDALCIRYPSMHFLKVEIEKCPEVADAEKVKFVPTFKIYKLGVRMKEIVCPSKESLENSVRHYCL